MPSVMAVFIWEILTHVKHIEIQLLCDQHKNVVALGERECSIQRKNQKLLEESPSPSLTPEIRETMMAISQRPLWPLVMKMPAPLNS